MHKFYCSLIAVLLLVNVLIYGWYGTLTLRSRAAGIELPQESTEIFGEFIGEIKNPLKMVQQFAGGAKKDGFSGGLEAVNVPMQEALDKSIARCMAWLDTQALPGEEAPSDPPAFDPKGEFETPNLCEATNYSQALQAGGSMTINELLSTQEQMTERKQLNYDRCVNMVGNTSTGYQKIWELTGEGKRLLAENSQLVKELQTELKAFKEMFTFLIRTPRVYTESDCS